VEELTALKEILNYERPIDWDSLPDIELYMDQVLTYMPRQQVAYNQEMHLTSSMINNYIKEGLLSRANGKKYSREHLAYLTIVCVLKQVLTVKDIAVLLNQESLKKETPDLYRTFNETLDFTLSQTAEYLSESAEAVKDLSQIALNMAIASYANKLACERIIDIIRQETEEVSDSDKKDKSKK
jgi:hypothetical protein